MPYRYIIAIGSNRRHVRHGAPVAVVGAGCTAVAAEKAIKVRDVSHVVASRPVGPSQRRYANAVALLQTKLDPPALLLRLKAIEQGFGRRAGGRRWGQRVLDLDIILWSEGCWSSRALTVPHISYRERAFVLEPLCAMAPQWRDPVTGLTPRHLLRRLQHSRPVDGACRTR